MTDGPTWVHGFMELFIVLAFAAAWGIMEWKGRQLDRKREREEAQAAATVAEGDVATGAAGQKSRQP